MGLCGMQHVVCEYAWGYAVCSMWYVNMYGVTRYAACGMQICMGLRGIRHVNMYGAMRYAACGMQICMGYAVCDM